MGDGRNVWNFFTFGKMEIVIILPLIFELSEAKGLNFGKHMKWVKEFIKFKQFFLQNF